MYMDDAVLAGIITVGACVVFFGGFAVFIWNDMQKKKEDKKNS